MSIPEQGAANVSAERTPAPMSESSAENAGRTAGAPATITRVPWVATIVFVVLAYGVIWAMSIPLWRNGGLLSPMAGPLIQAMMFAPAVAVLVVMLVLRPVPKGARLRFLGLWPLRPAGRTIGLSVLGLLAPLVIVFASILIAGALGWVQLDFAGLSGFRQMLEATAPEGVDVPPAEMVILSQLLSVPLVAATYNALFAFGEEIGWRGFLLPALRPLGTWPALLISGAIWGLWHAPIILLGYNFARYDITGVLFMVLGCIAWGVVLGWLRLRSASVWPAVFAHGSLNAVAAMIAWFFAVGTTFDMAFAGPLGIAGVISCALAVVVLLLARQFRVQPELAPARRRERPHPSPAP